MRPTFTHTEHLESARPVTHTIKSLLVVVFALAGVVLLPTPSFAQQATLTDDAHTSAANPSEHYGSDESVRISSAAERGFIKFKLTPNLPAGTTGGHVGKATLKLFVADVTAPGAVSIYRVAGAWDEGAVTDATAPALGDPEAAVTVNADQAGKWLTVDLTQLVKDWLDDVLPNNGVALVAGAGGAGVLLNSKENSLTSHEARLEIVLSHAATADRAVKADRAAEADHAASADAAAYADVARGVMSSSSEAFKHPTAGQVYFNTTSRVFRQYDGAVWKTIDADLAAQLSSAGTLNAPTNPVDWTQLKNVPANAASGYSAGGGIQIDGSNVISNTGVLAINASGPLSSSGGQNPTVSLSGVVPIASGGTGSSTQNFVDLSTGQTIGGVKTFSGAVNTNTHYNIAGQPVLSAPGLASNLYAGFGAGNSNVGTTNNSFFGFNAGHSNTTGSDNSFFGTAAGYSNTTGLSNSFFGAGAGNSNTEGGGNTFFGNYAGRSNTTGGQNAFFGVGAGSSHTTGSGNTIIGTAAGYSNTTENNNTFIGANTNGAPGITNATAIGAGAHVTQSHSVVLGSGANVGIGTTAPTQRLHVNGNIRISGPGGLIFSDGTTMFTAPSSSPTASDLNCTGCVSEPELNFDPATQVELDAHKSSGDHDARYSLLGHSHSQFTANNSSQVVSITQGGSGTALTASTASSGYVGAVHGIAINSYSFGIKGEGNGEVFSTGVIGIANSPTGGGIGVHGRTNSSDGVGVQGFANKVTATAGVFNNEAGGKILSGLGSFTERFSVDGGGNLFAYGSVGVGISAPKARLHVEGGSVLVGSPGQGIILKSPNGATCRLLSIDNAGAMVLSPVACP